MRFYISHFILIFLSICSESSACSISPAKELREVLPTATNIFIFRLDSSQLQVDTVKNQIIPNSVLGRIKIIRTFRGEPTYKYISYSTAWCVGGNRLDVGNYFLAATYGGGNTLKLYPHDESIIDITRTLQWDPVPLISALKKGTLPDGFPSTEQRNYTLTFGYPAK
jgi:hypothetical protein